MSTTTIACSPDMMPLLGQKSAPTKFTGNPDKVKRFLKHYKQLCNAYNLTDDKEKCERLTDYCSSKVNKLIEALDSYENGNWSQLEKDLLRYYDADLKETRYIVRDLYALTRQWRLKPIKSLTKWKRYEHKFMTIAGWLESKKKITGEQKNSYF